MRNREGPLLNPTWEEMVERDPLITFSWYLSGRVGYVLELGSDVVENLDAGYTRDVVDGERVGRAGMLMWFWILGAYEVVRTMCQAKKCFSQNAHDQLTQLKQELEQARMPAAKMEPKGKRRAVTSNRSPEGWDAPNRDLLVGNPTSQMISARHLLKKFEDVVSSIGPGDILCRHEDSYHGNS